MDVGGPGLYVGGVGDRGGGGLATGVGGRGPGLYVGGVGDRGGGGLATGVGGRGGIRGIGSCGGLEGILIGEPPLPPMGNLTALLKRFLAALTTGLMSFGANMLTAGLISGARK